VNLTFEDRATPEHYKTYPGAEDLGPTMKMWPVQTVDFGEPWIDPGVVSSPFGFEDSPDAEIISSGINSKGPDSVAIGRHGNFLLWGFFAPPSQMTDEAKKVLANAIVYIDQFDGKPMLVRAEAMSREWLRTIASYVSQFGDQAASILQHYFPADVVAECGTDQEKYVAWIDANIGYVAASPANEAAGRPPMSRSLTVDEDARALGIANNDIAILEKCIDMLESDDPEQTSRAERTLERYTRLEFESSDQWRAWLDENRDRLFFTDVGGYRWMTK